jgi:hypothetical protein
MALRVIAALLALLVLRSAAEAQDSVKRLVFEDCERARSEFAQLTIEQQSSLLDFLARVVTLNTQSPSAPEVYAVVPGTQISGDAKGLSAPRGTDLIPGALWQSMDAKRELRAKKCVLDILEGAGARALPVLTSLVATYSEQPLSDEIAVIVEEVSASIAELAHLQGNTLEPKQIEAIVPHALGQRPLVARNIIHEFRDEALPYFISLIATKNEAPKPDLLKYLQLLDPDGSRAMRAAIHLVPGLTAEQTKHLATVLRPPSKAVLPLFVAELIQLASDPVHSSSFTPLLGKACLTLQGITTDQAQQNSIAAIPLILERGTLPSEELECLIRSSAPLAKKLVTLLNREDTEQQRYAVALCSRSLERSPADIRGEAYVSLRRLALDPSSPIWQESVLALVAFPERKTDSLAIAQQLISSAEKSSKTAAETTPTNPIFELLGALQLGKEASRFAGAIIRSLRSAHPDLGAILLAKRTPALDPLLVTLALTVPPTKSSLSALDVLTDRKDIPHKVVPQLIELLKYPETLPLSERGLTLLGKASIAPLRKSLSRLLQGPPRLAALGVLTSSGAATKVETRGLLTGLASLQDCSFITPRATVLCDLNRGLVDDSEGRQILEGIIHRCLPDFPSAALETLAQCCSDCLLDTAEQVGPMLKSNSLDSNKLEPLLTLAIKTNQSDPQRAGPLLAQLLENGPNETRERILGSIPAAPRISTEVQETLKKIATDTHDSSEFDVALIHALASAGVMEFPWREFVKKTMEAASTRGLDRKTAEVISIMPVDPVLSEVLPALESDNSERLIGAALVGAALGPKAVPLVSRLWHLRTMRSPAVRYVASLALLEINPLTPDMHDTLRKILANRFFDTAAAMPIKWANTVAVNDLGQGTFGTLRKEHLATLIRAENL